MVHLVIDFISAAGKLRLDLDGSSSTLEPGFLLFRADRSGQGQSNDDDGSSSLPKGLVEGMEAR